MLRQPSSRKPFIPQHSRVRGGRERQQDPAGGTGGLRPPYLTGHGGATELEKFHQAWKKKANEEHPLFVELFFERIMPTARVVPITQAELDAEPNNAARDKLRDSARKCYVDQKAKLQAEAETLCKKYLSTLSEELQATVRTRATFADAWNSFNPLALIRVVESTIHNPQGAADASSELVALAQRAFFGIKQYDTENIPMYFNRFIRTATHYESLIAEAMRPTMAMKVQLFIDGFNARCHGYTDEVNEEVAKGRNDVVPLSVADASTKASNWLNRKQQRRGPSQFHSPSAAVPPQAVYSLDRAHNPRAATAASPVSNQHGKGPRRPPPPPRATTAVGTAGTKPTPNVDCYHCGKHGHYKSNCPLLNNHRNVLGAYVSEFDYDEDAIVHMMTRQSRHDFAKSLVAGVPSAAGTVVSVQMDSAAQLSVVRDVFPLDNERPCAPITVRGIAGAVRLNRTGYFGPLKCYKSDHIPANIFCLADVEKCADVQYVQGYGMIVRFHGDENEYHFTRGANNLYTCVVTVPGIYSTTIEERARNFTKAEADRARGVHELRRQLGGASTQDLLKFLGTSPPINCPYHAEDVRRELVIYGPDVPNLRGKMTTPQPESALVVPVDHGEQRYQQLHVDIFEVSGVIFLLAVMVPLKYTFAASLNSKGTPDLLSAAQTIVTLIQSKGFVVTKVTADPESGLVALVGLLPIEVEIVSPGTHVVRAERQGRVVKERMRSVIHALPFDLAARFFKYLVFFVVTRLNLIPRPSDGSNVSPRERFTKKKIVFNREFSLSFGDTAEIFNPPAQLNSMEPRSVPAMALYPIGNEQGGWRFYKFAIGTVVSSNKWVKTPIQALQIQLLNAMAAEDGVQIGRGRRPRTTIARNRDPGLVPFERMLVNPDLNLDVPPLHEEVVHADEDLPYIATDERVEELPDTDEPVVGGTSAEVGVSDTNGAGVDVPDADLVEPEGEKRSARLAESNAAARNYNVFAMEHCAEIFRLSERDAVLQYGEMAAEAILEEFKQIAMKTVVQCLRYADLTPEQRTRIIHSSLFLKEKFDDEGVLKRLKARLVAAGNEMNRDLYEPGSSPTVAREAVFALMALSAARKCHRMYIDIGTAFLEAPMGDDEVFMYIGKKLVPYLVQALPEAQNFIDDKGRVLVRLRRALYGCIQSSRLWYEHLRKILVRGGFKVNPYDSCVFHKNTMEESCTICVHVDDLFVSSSSREFGMQLLDLLKAELSEVKVTEGKVNSYLGMRITETDEHLAVDMCAYVNACIEWMNVPGLANTPADVRLFEISDESPLLCSSDQERFHSAAARVLYASKGCRPDILPAVSFLTSRVGRATEEDAAKCRRVFKYLRRNPDLAILFRKNFPAVDLRAYVDAGYGVHPTGQSRSGLVIMLNGAPILCKSSRQHIVTKSSTEAELVALSDALTDVIWVREFLMAAGCDLPATFVGEDNEAVLKMLRERKFGTARTKHINVRYFFIVDRIANGELEPGHVPTELQIADYMTKPLVGHQFEFLRSMLLGLREPRVPAGGVLVSSATKPQ